MKKLILFCALFAGLGLAEAPVSAAAYEVQNANEVAAPCCGETILGLKYRAGESGKAFNKRLQKAYSYEASKKSNTAFSVGRAKESLAAAKAKQKEAKKAERVKAQRDKIYAKIEKLKNQ